MGWNGVGGSQNSAWTHGLRRRRLSTAMGRLWYGGWSHLMVLDTLYGSRATSTRSCTEILQDDLLGTYQDLHLDYHDRYFQQDNDPKHTSKLAQAWFHKNHVDLLPWPPNSPDINIIENLWDHLERQVWARNPLPRSEGDLWVALQEEWYKIDLAFIRKLYKSLPQRVSAVYRANGGNTRY